MVIFKKKCSKKVKKNKEMREKKRGEEQKIKEK